MGWEVSDNKTFAYHFNQHHGKSVAILGDCKFGVPNGPQSLEEFKSAYNMELVDTFDLFGSPTHKLDLNEAIPKPFTAKYDWVVDAGTAFCCFNPAQVLKNIHQMIKVGGRVFQFASMFGYLNRAYYSFHPILLIEFYKTNGYEDIQLYYRVKGHYWKPLQNINMFNEDAKVPNDTCVLIVAQKTQEGPAKAPIPGLYSDL